MRHLFVTGTDTGVGKTHFSSLLLRALTAQGKKAVGFKPIACGDREDAETLHTAGDPTATLNEINPVFLRPPVSPLTASIMENRRLDPTRLIEAAQELASRYDHVIAEGAGGWLVPVTTTWSLADLAAELKWPVVIVVGNQLGALNHALLTLESVQSKGLECLGFIVNHLHGQDDPAKATNAAVLEEISPVPVLGALDRGTTELSSRLLTRLIGA